MKEFDLLIATHVLQGHKVQCQQAAITHVHFNHVSFFSFLIHHLQNHKLFIHNIWLLFT